MKRICAISSWIHFLISTDILSVDYFSALRAMGFCPSCSPHCNDKMIYPDTMTRATLTIAGVAFLCIGAADSPPVTFVSPRDCRDNHGKHRCSVKIESVTPSDIYRWPGLDVPLTQSPERTGIENQWFALTGRVVALKVEADGDLHTALQDATGEKPGIL